MIVANVGAGCGGRFGAVTCLCMWTNDVEADGEVVWFGRPDAGVKSRGIIRAATVTTKPGRREEHEGNR